MSAAPRPEDSTQVTRRPGASNPDATALASRDAVLPASVETSAAAVAAQARAAVEARYVVAMQRPRDWDRVHRSILSACDRPGFAAIALYRKPVGSSEVVGPSIRFAEEAIRWLGNAMADAVVTFDNDEMRIIRVTVTDLEANLTYPTDVVVEKTVERSSVRQGQEVVSQRTNSRGKQTYRVKAGEDEMLAKQNALVSKAMRTGVVRLIPADMMEEYLSRIHATATKAAGADKGKATEQALAAFKSIGVPQDHLEGYLGHPASTLSAEELATLRGIYQAIKDGETTWADVIARVPDTSKRKNPTPLRSDGYEVKAEVIDVAGKPKMTGPLPSDPYHTTGLGDGDAAEDDRSLDQRLADEG